MLSQLSLFYCYYHLLTYCFDKQLKKNISFKLHALSYRVQKVSNCNITKNYNPSISKCCLLTKTFNISGKCCVQTRNIKKKLCITAKNKFEILSTAFFYYKFLHIKHGVIIKFFTKTNTT